MSAISRIRRPRPAFATRMAMAECLLEISLSDRTSATSFRAESRADRSAAKVRKSCPGYCCRSLSASEFAWFFRASVGHQRVHNQRDHRARGVTYNIRTVMQRKIAALCGQSLRTRPSYAAAVDLSSVSKLNHITVLEPNKPTHFAPVTMAKRPRTLLSVAWRW